MTRDPSASRDDTSTLDPQTITVARLELLIPAVRKSFFTSILSVAIFTALLYATDTDGVVRWLSLRIVVSILCVVALDRLASSQNPRIRPLAVLMGVSGIVWGLLPALIQPAEPEWQAVIVLWIFGNQAVITAVCAPDRPIFGAAIGSVTLVSAVAMFLHGDGFSTVLAGIILLGGVYGLSVFSTAHASTNAAIRGQLTSDALAASLATKQTELTAANIALTELAHSDVMTGLPNRRGFIAALTRADRTCTRSGWMGIVDLDGFKRVNDTKGHPAGDEVLAEVAARWQALLPDDLLARTGGDEFAFVVGDASDVATLSQQIIASVDHPIITTEGNVTIGCSVGIARFHEGEALSSAMARADRALYRAKAAGKSCAVIDRKLEANHRRPA